MEDVKTVEKFPRGLWLLAVTSFAAAILLFQGAVYLVADFHPDRAAIGQEIRRQTVFDSYEVGYITPTRGGQSSFDQMKADGLTPVLWIGASHLYTIVNFQKDDRNSSWWVNNAAKEDGSRYRFLQYGMGNLNLNEALFILLSYLESGRVPAALVLGSQYDDFDDNASVRPQLVRLFRVDLKKIAAQDFGPGISNIREVLANSDVPQYIQNPINKTAYKADTPFTRFDRSLTRFIEKHWTAYAKRRLVQAWARYNFQEIQKSALQHLRFWRQPRTSRKTKVILQRPPLRADTKNWNLDALETIFRLAQAYEFSVLIYNVPTPDVPTFAGEFPFDRRDYDNLNATIRSMADRYSAAHYTDLERLIPWSDWKDSIALGHRLDFSHFNGHGHEKLGNRVYNLIKGIR